MGDNRLIRERYRLIELIGRGGMGEVWRGQDEELGRKVAVKCLKQLSPTGDPQHLRVMRERFRREARVAAGLQHRGITVVHDFGADDDLLYLVMELLEGRTLSQLLDEEQGIGLPVPDLIDIGEQVSTALAYCHAQGVVHRDLKPANILRLGDGTVKICDFGIARLGHDIGLTSKLTGTGLAMGTPHYMSPEQIGGVEVDHRSDLYSFGCVLYELATGAPPFDLDDAWAVLIRHRSVAPEPPRGQRPDLPEAVERLILDLLAKEPDDRPQDASIVARRLAAARTVADLSVELPSWARGLTNGVDSAYHRRGLSRRDGATALTGTWFGRTALQTPPAPTPTLPAQPVAHPPTVADHPSPAHPVQAPPPASARPTPGPVPVVQGGAGGPGPAEALAARHNAGLGLGRAGRWAEAVEVYGGVVRERERLLGPEHPDTLASRYELAFGLSRIGRPVEALAAYEAVAAARERVLGPDHPDTLAARQETGYVLGQLGRHQDAHQVYVAVLAARERVMGPDHPDTLRCRHNLAYNLGRLGRTEDAYRTAREVAAARERVLGPADPDTLVTRFEVAYALGRLGQWEAALAEYRAVAAARQGTLGPDHPDTLAATYEVGICLGRLGRSEEALELYRELAAARARLGGPEEPETLRARHGYGVNLGRLGRWDEALAQARDVCAIRERVIGPDHPDTLISRREVAVALGWLGRWGEALGAYRTVAEARTRTLGPAHPDTLSAREDEAHCLEQLGHRAEAAELLRNVAAVRAAGRPAH
jgi:serine/threonine protein kinase/tetratricopeptide (TPR) repeat protein